MASVDIDIIANPASLIASVDRMRKAKDDVLKGVAGAGERWDTEFNRNAESLNRAVNRTEQGAMRLAASYVRVGQASRLTGEEQIVARANAVKSVINDKISNATKLAKALSDVNAEMKKQIETERASRARKGWVRSGSAPARPVVWPSAPSATSSRAGPGMGW